MNPGPMGRRRFLRGAAAGSAAWLGAPFVRLGVAAAPDELTAFIDSQIDQGIIPGAGVLVTRGGETVYEAYRGTCLDAGERVASFDGSVVNPCYSFSKLVSATVIGMLVQDGLLDYDSPVSGYIPPFAGGGKEKITLGHLLTHSAGIPAMPLKPVATPQQWAAAVDAVCAASVEWEPGARCVYHALSGMFIAAEAARRVTGREWTDLCRERLFEPLGAASMTFGLPPETTPRRSIIPRPEAGVVHQLGYGGYYGLWVLGHPAGGCFATPADMAKVLRLHLQKGVWNGKSLIGPDVLRRMHTVQYQQEIDDAIKSGRVPQHQTWGLGPLMRGASMPQIAFAIPGYADLTEPEVFGHPGLDTVMTVGVPSRDLAIVFVSTDSPKPAAKVADLRNGVTARALRAFG